MTEPWGCYVHVPWCRVQCPYCAFYVETDLPRDGARFAERVLEERAAHGQAFPGSPATVYFGGGTPSQLEPSALGEIVTGLGPRAGAEVVAEANPEDLTHEWLEQIIERGVNRISLGVQSLVRHVSGRLGRAHTREQAFAALRKLQRAPLTSWSADLIFAVPDQTLADLDQDLDHLLEFEVPHVSLYGLTFEPETPFGRALSRGRVAEPDADTWHAMYTHIVDRLEAAGIHRYEISNFARPGHESRHNSLYWTDRPYLGLGPGAHGYRPDGVRWHNPPDLHGYLAHGPTPPMFEHPSAHEAASDLIISGLRGVGGLSRHRLGARTGLDVDADTVARLVAGGLLTERADRIALGPRGFALADGIAHRLVDGLRPASPSG